MDPARILAVDDEPRQLSSLRRILRRSKYEVVTATSGRLGLRMAAREPPDLILLDVNMPAMSGYEFLRRFRRLELRRVLNRTQREPHRSRFLPIPVLFVTGLAKPDQRRSGLDAGAVDYITKPFDAEELRARIRSQLRRVRQEREAIESTASELSARESTLSGLREAAHACIGSLIELTHFVDRTEYELNSHLRGMLLQRARRDISRLLRTVSDISEQPVPDEVLT